MNDKKLEFVVGKKYLTRNNCVATCVSTNGAPYFPNVFVIDGQASFTTNSTGRALPGAALHPYDIVAKYYQPSTVYLNVYATIDGVLCATTSLHHSRDAADKVASLERVGCIKVELAARFDK